PPNFITMRAMETKRLCLDTGPRAENCGNEGPRTPGPSTIAASLAKRPKLCKQQKSTEPA
ncbi:MAG: hypothetical protein WBA36_16255, partial [Mesorhizobium sp.]